MVRFIFFYILVLFFFCPPSLGMEDKHTKSWEQNYKDLIFEKHPDPVRKNSHSKKENTKGKKDFFENSTSSGEGGKCIIRCLSQNSEVLTEKKNTPLLPELTELLFGICGKDQNNARLKLSSLNFLVAESYSTTTKLWKPCAKNQVVFKKSIRDSIRNTLKEDALTNNFSYVQNIINLRTLKKALQATDPLYLNTYYNYSCWASGQNFYGTSILDEKKILALNAIDSILDNMKQRRKKFMDGKDDSNEIEKILLLHNV